MLQDTDIFSYSQTTGNEYYYLYYYLFQLNIVGKLHLLNMKQASRNYYCITIYCLRLLNLQLLVACHQCAHCGQNRPCILIIFVAGSSIFRYPSFRIK